MPGILGFYAGWYPPLWLRGLAGPFRYGEFGKLATHLRFIERSARKLARESFHGMSVYQAKMERKQGFLFRCVDVVMELFAMSAAVSRAKKMTDAARAAGATVLMSNHTEFDRAYDRARIAQLPRRPGEKHPYESDEATVQRYFEMLGLCAEAQRLETN